MKLPVKIGILGCGAIAPAYLKNISKHFSSVITATACADLSEELARKLATEFSIPKVMSPEELMYDPDVEIIVNLTPAPAHFQTSMDILEAGKHLFTEKPLGLELEQGKILKDTAREKGLQIAGAPDIFLGAGHQESANLLRSDAIGTPIGATAAVTIAMFDVERYHKVFNGALLDLSPYYLTVLVQHLGPIVEVTGLAPMRFEQRTDPKTGITFNLKRPATCVAALQFESGPVATLFASQDVGKYLPRIELFGTKGKLVLTDANHYTGTLTLETKDTEKTQKTDSTSGFAEEGRALGLAEMAVAMRNGRTPRADGDLMYHILEIIHAVYTSASTGQKVSIESTIEPADPFTLEDLKECMGS